MTLTDAHPDVSAESTTLSLTVLPPPVVITTDPPLPEAQYGQFYSVVFEASGGSGSVTWTMISGELPRGLRFSSSGEVSGKPNKNGSPQRFYTFEIVATDANTLLAPSEPRSYTIEVNCGQSRNCN